MKRPVVDEEGVDMFTLFAAWMVRRLSIWTITKYINVRVFIINGLANQFGGINIIDIWDFQIMVDFC